MTAPFHLACASNSASILAANLAASPVVRAGIPFEVIENGGSAAQAYNLALDRIAASSGADLVVFAHHDVYLPNGWESLLARRVAELDAHDPDWALAGAFGISMDHRHFGPVWTSSLGQIVGRVPFAPEQVQSFDEMLIVLRRSSGVRFSDGLPGWHLYGTDVVCKARAAGKKAYALGLNCIHNDRFHEGLDESFAQAYHWIRKEWRDSLPVRTPITKISRSGLHLYRDTWEGRKSRKYRQRDAVDTGLAPHLLAARCGWSDLSLSCSP